MTKSVLRSSSVDSHIPPVPPANPSPIEHAVRFSGASAKTASSNSSVGPLSRAESEAVFSRVEFVSVETGRYYNSSRDAVGGNQLTPSKISLVDSGYVVYEILVKANFDVNFAWTCHRRYKNFLELDDSLPPVTGVESAGSVWDDEDDSEFDYVKGIRLGGGQQRKKSKNTYPPRPKLPPKKLLGNFSDKLIESRRIALNKYLRYLFLNPYTRCSEAFLSFISAERLISSMQVSGGLTPGTASTFFTSHDFSPRNSAVGFVPTPSPAKNQKQMGAETLTSFPYAFRSTNGAGALGGWGETLGSERKKKKKKGKSGDDFGGSLCAIL